VRRSQTEHENFAAARLRPHYRGAYKVGKRPLAAWQGLGSLSPPPEPLSSSDFDLLALKLRAPNLPLN